jgi:hypothetical protein
LAQQQGIQGHVEILEVLPYPALVTKVMRPKSDANSGSNY